MLHRTFAIGASFLAVLIGTSLAAGQRADPIEKILSDARTAYDTHVEQAEALVSPDDMLNRAKLGLADVSDKTIGQTATIELVDLRFVLVEMARASGANDQLTVLRAQPDARLKALSVRGGTASLAAVLTKAKTLGFIGENGVTVPVVVQSDGKLIIYGNDLKLDRQSGAFLANLGRLEVLGGSIKGQGGENPNASEFRPFVLTTGTGSLSVRGAVFEALGFGTAPAFSGFAVIEAGLYRPTLPSSMSDVLLRDVNTTFVQGSKAFSLTDSIFQNSSGAALELRGTQDALVARNLFLDAGGDALRVSQNARGTMIKNTEIYGAALNGITVNIASHQTRIDTVKIWNAAKAAISIEQSDCVSITHARALRAGQKGISLRTTRGTKLANNDILAARGAGLFVAEQPDGTILTLSNNRIAGNRDGLSTAAPAEIHLMKNDFSQQFPRFMKGDLSSSTTALIADLKGAAPMTLKAGGTNAAFVPPLTCTLETES